MFAGALSVGIPQNDHVRRRPLDSHRPVWTLAFDVVFYMGVSVSEPSFRSSDVIGVSHALKTNKSELKMAAILAWKYLLLRRPSAALLDTYMVVFGHFFIFSTSRPQSAQLWYLFKKTSRHLLLHCPRRSLSAFYVPQRVFA